VLPCPPMPAPTNPSLDGVRAKIRRAEHHVDEFKSALFKSIGDCPVRVEVRHTEELPEGRRVTGDITVPPPLPALGVYLGDAVHNLRSALDHLVCQLAVAAGNDGACASTQFPIFAEDNRDTRKRIDQWTKHVRPSARSAIQALQPYQRRPTEPTSDPLWLLSVLDNIDKHRVLLVANPKMAALRVHITIDDETRSFTVSNHPGWSPLSLSTIPLRFVVPHDSTKPTTQVRVKAEPLTGVVFAGTGLPCDGQEIFPTTRSMIADVKAIVETFNANGLFDRSA
jgi:hypothetical protein